MPLRHVLCLLLLLAAAGCADHIGTTFEEAPRDLTSAALARRLATGERVRAETFPLGAPLEGRRCGGPVGTTKQDGLPGREPLQSSIAWATDGLLGDPFVPGRTYERQLRAASIRHDQCYGHGLATYGRTRRDCDLWIRADALRLCSSVEGTQTLARCNLKSEIPFLAVAPLGWTFYGDNLQPTCEYDPGVNPPRDFVLGGRFLRRSDVLPGQVLHVAPAGNGLRLRMTAFPVGRAGAPVLLLDTLLPLDAVPLGGNWDGPLPDGRCLRAPCTLAEAGLVPQDFLALAPKVADLDGDGLDDVAFVAVHGLRNPYAGQHGMVAFALGLADPAQLPRTVAGWVRTHDEQATQLPSGYLSNWAVRQQIDVLGQSWLAGRFLREPRDQLLLFALRVEREAGERRLEGVPERGFAEFRLLDFPPDPRMGAALGPPRLRRTLFREDGVIFSPSRGRDGPFLTELYRRFQNPPMPWRGPDGRLGVAVLARDTLDTGDARPFRIPEGVRNPDSQDRGARVILYGPPDPPTALPPADARFRDPGRSGGPPNCSDLASWDPDWFGCRRASLPLVHSRFVWNWSREVNPVVELPGSGQVAAVSLGTDARWPGREVLLFDLSPPLRDASRDGPGHLFVQRFAAAPALDGSGPISGDGKEATVAGSWLAYPALAARLGPAGEGGLALFRTVQRGDRAVLEVASAVPANVDGKPWRFDRAACPLPATLAATLPADARPNVAEGGRMAHLRLSPVLRIAGSGARDAFAIATRVRRPGDGTVASAAVDLAVIEPSGPQGWSVQGRRCETLTFDVPQQR